MFLRRVDHHESTPGLLAQLACVCVVSQSCLWFVTYGERVIVQVSVGCAFWSCEIYNKRLYVAGNLFSRFTVYIFFNMIRFYVGMKYTLRELCLFITTDISERKLSSFFELCVQLMISMSYKSWSIQFSQEQKVLIFEKNVRKVKNHFHQSGPKRTASNNCFPLELEWQYDLRFIQITSCITNIQNLD